MPNTFTEDPTIVQLNGHQYKTSDQELTEGCWFLDTHYKVPKLHQCTNPLWAKEEKGNKWYAVITHSSDPNLGLPEIEEYTPPNTKEYYLDQAHNRFSPSTSLAWLKVVEAVEYMSDEKAIEYLKQVQTP